LKYSFSYIDDVGLLRTKQEDSGFIISSLKKKLSYSVDNQSSSNVNDIILMCVADGMGGAENGALASAICTSALKEYFLNLDFDDLTKDIIGCGKQAVIAANEKILARKLDDPATAGMGTTVVLGLIFQNVLHVFWIGDSRCYLFNDNNLTQISKDHSYVQELIDKGVIYEEDEFDHPQKNIITQSLGSKDIIPGYNKVEIEDSMFILLCSDGLNTMLRQFEIQNVFLDFGEAEEINNKLLSLVLDRGAFDNVSLCLCKAEKEQEDFATGTIQSNTTGMEEIGINDLQQSENIVYDSNKLKVNSTDILENLSDKTKIIPIKIGFFIFGITALFSVLIFLVLYFFNDKTLTEDFDKMNLNVGSALDSVDLFYKTEISDSSQNTSSEFVDTIFGDFQSGQERINNGSQNGNTLLIDTTSEVKPFMVENYKIRYDVYNTQAIAIKAMKKFGPKIGTYRVYTEKLDSGKLYGIFIETFKVKAEAEKLMKEERMENAVIVKITK